MVEIRHPGRKKQGRVDVRWSMAARSLPCSFQRLVGEGRDSGLLCRSKHDGCAPCLLSSMSPLHWTDMVGCASTTAFAYRRICRPRLGKTAMAVREMAEITNPIDRESSVNMRRLHLPFIVTLSPLDASTPTLPFLPGKQNTVE